jgi:hypothetical protein
LYEEKARDGKSLLPELFRKKILSSLRNSGYSQLTMNFGLSM